VAWAAPYCIPMRLNRLGRAAMNQPTRALAQNHYLAPIWERLGGRVEAGEALEVGCGRLVGASG
jgi:hypothetical protein